MTFYQINVSDVFDSNVANSTEKNMSDNVNTCFGIVENAIYFLRDY